MLCVLSKEFHLAVGEPPLVALRERGSQATVWVQLQDRSSPFKRSACLQAEQAATCKVRQRQPGTTAHGNPATGSCGASLAP